MSRGGGGNKEKNLEEELAERTRRRENKKTEREPSRWWLSGKSLGLKGLLPLWSQVRALWLLI